MHLRFLLSAAAVSSLVLAACAETPDSDPTSDEPAAEPGQGNGNVDGSDKEAGASGKEDAWNAINDPARFAQFAARDFKKKPEELPLNGRSQLTPWPDTYWPTAENGIAHRWTGDQGVDGFSPAEKYDMVFNGWTPPANFADLKPFDAQNCSAAFDTEYYTAIGPLARYISENRGNKAGYDKVDSDGDGKIDECDAEDVDGVEWWWGLCHAWVPASLNEPEPIHEITYNGVKFYPSDIKALMIQAYNRSRSMILGGRCNTKDPKRDENGRIIDDACRDTNAGAFHIVVTNMIGRHQMPIAEDRTYDYQVWNQPVYKYEVTEQTEVDLTKALSLINRSADGDYTKINAKAVRWMDVRATLYYVTESHASKTPMVPEIESYTRTDKYHYLLELDDKGEIIGGEWIFGEVDRPEWGISKQPDFLWFSTGPATDWGVPIDYAKVKQLLELSRAAVTPPTDPTEPTGNKLELVKDVNVAIPDNNTTGIEETLVVENTGKARTFSVQLDITHPYISDLKIDLFKDGTLAKTLWNKAGGSGDDIHQLITVEGLVGQAVNGTYKLKVVDGAREDEGTLVRWGVIAELE